MPGSACGTMTLRSTSPRRAPERVRHVDERAGHAAHHVGRHQRVEEDRADEQERHLGRLAEAQPDDEQRDERAGRQVAQQPDHRLEQRPARRGSVPMTMPSGTETSTARPKPSRTRCTVAQVSVSELAGRGPSHSPADQTAGRRRQERAGTAPLARSASHTASGTSTDSAISIQRARRGDRRADREQRRAAPGRPAPRQRRPGRRPRRRGVARRAAAGAAATAAAMAFTRAPP